MEKEDKIGCAIGFAVCIVFILVLGLIIAFTEISNGKFAKKPKETIQTYEVTYVNGLKDIVSYKVHEGTKAYIESSRGSYYLSFYYENTNFFGFKYRENDGSVPGVVSYKRVK